MGATGPSMRRQYHANKVNNDRVQLVQRVTVSYAISLILYQLLVGVRTPPAFCQTALDAYVKIWLFGYGQEIVGSNQAWLLLPFNLCLSRTVHNTERRHHADSSDSTSPT